MHELEQAMKSAAKALAQSGASHAAGNALALCYAKVAAVQYALTERLCFAALILETDEGKLRLLRRWSADPMHAVGDVLDAMEALQHKALQGDLILPACES